MQSQGYRQPGILEPKDSGQYRAGENADRIGGQYEFALDCVVPALCRPPGCSQFQPSKRDSDKRPSNIEAEAADAPIRDD